MNLTLYDSLKKHLTLFNLDLNSRKPLLIYVCGVTLYNDAHIGNLRPILIADLLIRFFKKNNISYEYMQSLTDISDKIKQASIERNSTEREISIKYEKNHRLLVKKMGFIEVDHFAKPSNYIKEISYYIRKLVSAKYAYENNGNIFFSVCADSNYGEFSHKNISKNITIKNNWTEFKIDKRDFSLWKAPYDSKQKIYNSDYLSNGRPGWHIECSVMASTLFQNKNRTDIDLCIGGIDLIFPHNENMLAQHRAIYKNNFSKCWINVGQVKLNRKKMAKSTGNLFLAKDFIDEYSADCIKYLLLKSSHQKTLEVNNQLIQEAERKIIKWKSICQKEVYLSNIDKNYKSTEYNKYICDNLNLSSINRKINQDIKLINNKIKCKNNLKKIKQIVNEINYCFWIIGFSFSV